MKNGSKVIAPPLTNKNMSSDNNTDKTNERIKKTNRMF